MGCCGSSSPKQQKNNTAVDKNLTPVDLLKIRLAQGEISFDEYEKTKVALEK